MRRQKTSYTTNDACVALGIAGLEVSRDRVAWMADAFVEAGVTAFSNLTHRPEGGRRRFNDEQLAYLRAAFVFRDHIGWEMDHIALLFSNPVEAPDLITLGDNMLRELNSCANELERYADRVNLDAIAS